MTIVIACDSFLALRNVRNGNLGTRLSAAGERVVVLVDPAQYEGSLQRAPDDVEIRRLLPFDAREEPQLKPLMDRAYMARKSYYDPKTLWTKLSFSSARNNTDNRLRRLASTARARLRLARYWWYGRQGRAQAWREQFAAALQQHPIMAEYERLLTDLDADVVVAFSLEGPREMALMEAARKMGLTTAVMIRSRDNLSSKIQHIPSADAYFVWAEITKEFLTYMYPEIAPEQVTVTGSPQFDRHLNAEYRLTRDEFFAGIGLDPARPVIVYTMATPNLIKHEINITQHLADAVRDGRFARDAQLLVRAHPRGFGSDFAMLHRTYPGVAVYPPPTDVPYMSAAHEADVVRLILEDEPMHLATLAYQDVQVNVSGTMLVDSAILDKPCVAVYYDIPASTPKGLSTRRFYERSDMRPIVNSGGVRMAHTPAQAIQFINCYLEDPQLDAEGRTRIRNMDVGPLDGRAGERLAEGILRLVDQRTRQATSAKAGAS